MKLRRAAIAASAAALLTVTACGSVDDLDESSSQSDAGEDSDADATDSDASDSDHADDSDDTDDTDADAEVAATSLTKDTFAQVLADAQLEATTASFDGTASFGADQMEMTGQMDAGASLADSSMSMQMEMPGMGTADLVLVDNAMYMSLGEMTDGKYIVLDLDDSQGLGAMMGGLDQLNVAEATRALEGSIEDLEVGGTDTMDGVEVTEYVVTVDTEAMYDQMEGPGADMGTEGLGLPETLEYSFWVGEDNLPRQMSMDLGPAGEMEINMSGWGEPVDIQAPAPNQISDVDPFRTQG